MTKRKILFVSECTASNTGFGKYYKEIINHLHNTGKFEIAELACYVNIDDPRLYSTPWKLYCNAVKPDDPRAKDYHSNPSNFFGEWRFEKVLLDYKSDFCVDCRDFWMLQGRDSPLRPYYHLSWMPTCDSSPIKEEWIQHLTEIDSIFAYNDWSLQTMIDESGGKIKSICSAPPAIDPTIFFPASNKQEHKQKMGFDPNINLIGMVARNQVRKLYPDLFIAFNKFLNQCLKLEHNDLAQNTFLFCHTSYPDAGWDLPLLLKEQNISHKVYFSYVCRSCHKWFPSLFCDARTFCPHCHNLTAVMPNVEVGVDERQLADIYKCLDIYTQLSIAGGFEMPIVEAAACGCYCMASDNTAMSDVIRKVNGLPLKLAHTFRELGTGAYRHYTDIENLAHRWHIYLTAIKAFPEQKIKQEKETVEGVLKHYTWQNTCKIWENYFENCELTGLQGKWNSPPRMINVRINKDFEKMSNIQFVEYLYRDILNKPEKLNKYDGLQLLSILNYGAEIDGRKVIPVTRKMVHDKFIKLAVMYNQCEEIRCGISQLPREDFLDYANIRMQ